MTDNKYGNLFTNLNRWAVRQNENFTTEGLVFLLNHFKSEDPKFACSLLNNMTDGFLNLNCDQAEKVKINTQTIIDEGKPDIEITLDDYLIYIEVKIDSELGEDQLSRYRKALEGFADKKTRLVFLSRYPLTSDKNGTPDVALRWYQIADWIRSAIKNDGTNDLSKFLLTQFFGFLKTQHLTLSKIKSPISEGLNHYRERYGDIGQSLQRMRSLEKLDADKALIPLSNLLRLMREAFSIIKVIPRLESGQTQGGWVGFVFNNLDFIFEISYSQPENLVFKTAKFKIDPDKFDCKLGKIWKQSNKIKWKDELNLSEIGFFQKDRQRQFEVIEAFLKQSYDYCISIAAK